MLKAHAPWRLTKSPQILEKTVLQALRSAEPKIGITDREPDRSDHSVSRQSAIARARNHLEAESRIAPNCSLQNFQPNRVFRRADAVKEMDFAPLGIGKALCLRKKRRDTDAASQPDLSSATPAEVKPSVGTLELHIHALAQGTGQLLRPAAKRSDIQC